MPADVAPATEVSVPFQFQWTELITPGEWRSIASILNLSDGQERFLWHALHDPREQAIARRMALTAHGAHSHRMAVFKKLKVDCMPGAIARVFAAYVQAQRGARAPEAGSPNAESSYLPSTRRFAETNQGSETGST